MPTPLTRTLDLNGQPVSVATPDDTERFLYILREQCGQLGPKFGCGVAQCGACTVLVNGAAARSCTTLVSTVPEGASVRTLDGLGTPEHPHPMQQAFIDAQAAQCAFCVNGMIMGAVAWIEARMAAGNNAVPSREETADFLSGASPESTFNYICRCGAHQRILAAIQAGAAVMTS
jgi:aerobic-type carbon monoxide dehydrogenase small subunit (CoxS/CutS family)